MVIKKFLKIKAIILEQVTLKKNKYNYLFIYKEIKDIKQLIGQIIDKKKKDIEKFIKEL